MTALSLLLLVSPAHANGQTAHLWISETALDELPEGEVRDFLTREDLRADLRNGTMFPDGGYPIGDDYAEIAHWEPFQSLYLEWIRAHYSAPWEDEAAHHIAFLFGMASHGMADQSYDALYQEKATQVDADAAWATSSMDEATDVVLASITGAQEVSEDVVPYDTLVEIYTSYGYTVSTETLERGQSLLRVAVSLVGAMGQSESSVQSYSARFPWGTSHLFDPFQRGNPPDEAILIAEYWQVLWKRLHDEPWTDEPVSSVRPWDGDCLPTSAAEYDAQPALVFSRGLEAETVTADLFQILDEEGAEIPFSLDLYYGQNSHVLLLSPESDWAEEADYTLTALPGIGFLGGTVLETAWSTTLSTSCPVERPTTTAAVDGTGCGCQSSPHPWSANRNAAGGVLAAAFLLFRRRYLSRKVPLR